MTRPIRAALADAAPIPFWLDSPSAPPAAAPLSGTTRCDLAVVGAGFTGLWTALLAKEADPSRDVLLIDGRTAGWAASGRNGGFCASSLTHGLANGLARFPDEMPVLERLGSENLSAIEAAISRYGIECGFERTGELEVATAPHQLAWLDESVEQARAFGHDAVSGSQNTRRSARSHATAPACGCARRRQPCTQAASLLPRTHSVRCCGARVRTSCRSMTTCW